MPADAHRSAGRPRSLAELSLVELRAHRRELREEENRISYWRRLVQARLDTSAAGRLSGNGLNRRQITVALGDGVNRHQRLGLLALEAGAELPELPELARLWATPLTPHGAGDEAHEGDAAADALTVAGLAEAEATLSAYRAAVHRLLDAATAELIRRYQADPTACLDVLPSVEPVRRVVAG